MPLTKSGEKILKKFEEEYGKKRGDTIFYSWEHKHSDLVLKNGNKR